MSVADTHRFVAAPAGRSPGPARGPGSRKATRKPPFPRLPLFGALAFIGFSVVVIIAGQRTGIGTVMENDSAPVAMVDLVINEPSPGRVRVSDATSGEVLAEYGAAEGGFVGGSYRGLARMRLVAQVSPETPYRVIEWANGAVSLSDTGTGQRIYLNAFGPDNVAAFARFLHMKGGHGK